MPSNQELHKQLAELQAENDRLRSGGVASYQSIASDGVKEWTFEVEYFRPVKGKIGGESLGKQTFNAVDEGEACRLYHLFENIDGEVKPRERPLTLTNCRAVAKCLDPKREELILAKYERINKDRESNRLPPIPVPRKTSETPRETQLEEVA